MSHDWSAEWLGDTHFILTCRACGLVESLDLDHVRVVPNRPDDPCPAHDDECMCPCHAVIQPGLIPCPRCEPEWKVR